MIVQIKDVVPIDSGNAVKLKVEIRSAENSERKQLYISASQYYDCGRPEAGEITEELYGRLESMSQMYDAIRKGAYLLSYSASNKSNLKRKLISKGISEQNASLAVDYLTDKGYIDELSQVKRLILRMADRNKYGKRRIASELYAKGYAREVISEAFDSFEDEIDFEENKKELVRAKFEGQNIKDPKVKQKIYSLLRRYGY